MTRFLPFVSAINSHKCEAHIIPTNATAPKIPFSCIVKCKSQSDTGSKKLMAQLSKITAATMVPVIQIK